MKRRTTNIIRWLMDELVPAFIRDSYIFMWPFYVLAYRTWTPGRYMTFKSSVFKMSPKDYGDFYNGLNSISRNRLTDNNEECIRAIVNDCAKARNVLDVGCGRGYMLRKLHSALPNVSLVGVDLLRGTTDTVFDYVASAANDLPFKDNSFDVVCCTHVIEHVINPEFVVAELVRVARKMVIVVTPKQRPYYFTLDEHINFFLYREQLERLVPNGKRDTKLLSGDWYMVISK